MSDKFLSSCDKCEKESHSSLNPISRYELMTGGEARYCHSCALSEWYNIVVQPLCDLK